MYNKKVLTKATRNLNKVKVRVKKRPPANQDNTIPSRSELDAFVHPTMDNTSLMKEGGEKQFVNSKEHGVDAPEYFQVQTGESPIHGTGVFTNEVIPAGSPIGVTHIRKTFEQNGNTYKAPFPAKVLGGYNHSENPNVTEVDNGDHIVMVALKDIEPGEELVSNYNDNTIEDLEKPEDFKNELTKANMGLITKGVKPVLNLATHKNPAKRFIGQRLADAGVTTLPLMFPDQLRDLGIRAGHLSQGAATFDLEDLLKNLSGSNTGKHYDVGDDFSDYVGYSLDTHPDFNPVLKEDMMRFNPDYSSYGVGKRDLIDLYFTGKDESFKEAPWLSHLEGAGSLDKYTKIHGPLKSYELQSLNPQNKPISGFDLFQSLEIANPKYSAKDRAHLKKEWSVQGVDTDYEKTGPKRILSPTHYSDFDKWKYKYLTEAAQSGDKEKIIRGFNKLFDRYGDVIPFEMGTDINQPASKTFARDLIQPMDDIAGHMKYLRRINPTTFDLTTRDVWGFHPTDYNKKWGIKNYGKKVGSEKEFELRNQDYIRSLGPRLFTKLGNPFILTQTNPLSFSPEMWKFKKKGGAVKQLPKASKGVGKVIQAATKTSKPLSKQLTLPLDFTSNISKLTHGISPEQIEMIQSKFNVTPQIDPSRYSITEFLDDVNFQLGQGLNIKKSPNLNLKLELDRPIGFYPKERFIDNSDYAFNLLSDFHTPGKFEKMGEIDLGKYKGDKEGKTFEKIYDFPFKEFSGPIPLELKGQGISGEANKAITNSLQRFGFNPLISSDRHTNSGLERWKRLVELGLAEHFPNIKNENRFQLLNWALPIIGAGAGAYGLSNPWQQEQPNYLLNRRRGGSTPDKYIQAELSQEEIDKYVKGGYIVEDLPKARYGLSVPKTLSTLSKTTKFKPIINTSQLSKLAPAINSATINASVAPFKSEINWAGWNPDTPLFEDLIREYNIIEQSSKAGGNWMKNADMSKFLGTPEQFVQFQSSNFNKAFPSGYETLYRGMRQNTGDLIYDKNKDVVGSSVFTTRDKDLAGYYLYDPKLANKILTRADSPTASGIYELARPKNPGITLNAGYSDWDAFDLLTPTEMRKDILDNYGAFQRDLANEGDFTLMDPLNRAVQKQRNELLSGQYSADDVVEKIRNEIGDEVSTDMLAAYADAYGVPYIEVKNVIDGKFGDVVIVNQKPGNYLKSLYGNVGFFDQTNPNVYKSQGGSLPKASLGKIVRQGLYKGVNPASYNISSKIKQFPKEFHLNTVSNATRPFRVGEHLGLTGVPERADQWLEQKRGMTFGEYNILPIEEKMKLFSTSHLNRLEDVGRRRLDAWATGLGLPQEYSTLEQIGDNTYRMLDVDYDQKYLSMLHKDLQSQYHKDNPLEPLYGDVIDVPDLTPLQKLTRDYRKLVHAQDMSLSKHELYEMFKDKPGYFPEWVQARHAKANDVNTGSVWDADNYGVMGGYRWDISQDPKGLLFTQRDLWDLKPFEKRGDVHLNPSEWRIKGLQMQPKARKSLENLEMLGLVGGKPFNIENNFLVDPETYKVIDKWKDGGQLPKARYGLETISNALKNTYKLNPLAIKKISDASLKWSPTSKYTMLNPTVLNQFNQNLPAGFDPVDMSSELIKPHWLKGYPKLSKKLDVTEWNDIASKVQESTYPVGNLTDIEREKLFDTISKTRNKELLARLSTYPVKQGLLKSNYIPKKEVGLIKPHQMFSNEYIGNYRRDLVNSHLYGGYDKGRAEKISNNLALYGAFPAALGFIGWAGGDLLLDDPSKNAINRRINYPVFRTDRSNDPTISKEDLFIDLNDNELTYGQTQDRPEGRILLGGDFVGATENTVRTAEEWLNASDNDTYGDDDFKTKDVVNYYGVEEGKLKVGKASEFKKDTKIVPNRYDKDQTVNRASLKDNKGTYHGLRLFDSKGEPIYHNALYGGKIILYSKDSGKALFMSHSANETALNKVNEFIKNNNNVVPVVLDNGRFVEHMSNPEGLTNDNYLNYYSSDFHRGSNSGYNIIIKKDGGEIPKARLGLPVPKIKLPKVKTPKIKPNITGIDAEIANLSKMTNTGLLDDFMITTDLGFKPSRDYSSVLHKLKDKEKDLGLSMWAPENAQKFTGDPINALTYSVLGPAIYGGNKLMNRILPTGVNTDLRKTITGHMDQRLSQQLSDTFLDPNQPIPLWDSNTTFHLGKKYGVDWQGYSDGFIERHNQNLLNQNTRVRDLELRAKRREWAKENNLTYDYKTDSYSDADGYMIPSPNFEAETQLLENPFDQSEIVQSGLGNLLTKPLTLFGKNELAPGNHLYRKIGNSAGLRDLINKGGAQAPGPLRMNSGFTINTPFFGVGESPNENYKGMYAVETPLPSKSKYDWTSRAGATNNYGVAPVDPETGALIENVPLEELNVYKRKPFSNNYKKLDPQNLEEGLKYADTQNLLENLWKWGVRGGLGYGAMQLGKGEELEEEKFGGGVNIGDEVDKVTMQRLINEGYTFEEI